MRRIRLGGWRPQRLLMAALSLAAASACSPAPSAWGRTWYERFAWKAEDYFDDPQAVALCRAIEANDLAEIDRLVAAGADVNARGKANMTPLLWAFPGNRPERLKKLLEHGADPNVVVESDFGTGMRIEPGDSVTHLACGSWFPGYFEAVFDHGGDPNLRNPKRDDVPLLEVLSGTAVDKLARVKRLIKLVADVNAKKDGKFTAKVTPVGLATIGRQYDIALVLLSAGADYKPDTLPYDRVIDKLANQETAIDRLPKAQRAAFHETVKWLEEHGESMSAARRRLQQRRNQSNLERQ